MAVSVQQPFPGIYVWRDPHGAFYLVDHTGTRQLPNTGDRQAQPPRKPMLVERWHTPITIDVDYAA
jgi:hypothetical protein